MFFGFCFWPLFLLPNRYLGGGGGVGEWHSSGVRCAALAPGGHSGGTPNEDSDSTQVKVTGEQKETKILRTFVGQPSPRRDPEGVSL